MHGLGTPLVLCQLCITESITYTLPQHHSDALPGPPPPVSPRWQAPMSFAADAGTKEAAQIQASNILARIEQAKNRGEVRILMTYAYAYACAQHTTACKLMPLDCCSTHRMHSFVWLVCEEVAAAQVVGLQEQ